MAKDIAYLKDIMNQHFGKANPLSPTQSPKTPEEKNSLDHDFAKNFQTLISQVHFKGARYYTRSPKRNLLKIKNELPKYDGKDHKGAIVWVNKMHAIFSGNPTLGSQEKVITTSNYL